MGEGTGGCAGNNQVIRNNHDEIHIHAIGHKKREMLKHPRPAAGSEGTILGDNQRLHTGENPPNITLGLLEINKKQMVESLPCGSGILGEPMA